MQFLEKCSTLENVHASGPVIRADDRQVVAAPDDVDGGAGRIHPEMITHTRVIDLKTGRPFEEISAATMENSYPREKKSVDELSAYLAYALRILKNCDLPCQGITTPGGFGNLVKSELSQAVQEAVRDVYEAEIPHYFKYVHGGDESTEPTLEHVSGLDTNDVRVTGTTGGSPSFVLHLVVTTLLSRGYCFAETTLYVAPGGPLDCGRPHDSNMDGFRFGEQRSRVRSESLCEPDVSTTEQVEHPR